MIKLSMPITMANIYIPEIVYFLLFYLLNSVNVHRIKPEELQKGA